MDKNCFYYSCSTVGYSCTWTAAQPFLIQLWSRPIYLLSKMAAAERREKEGLPVRVALSVCISQIGVIAKCTVVSTVSVPATCRHGSTFSYYQLFPDWCLYDGSQPLLVPQQPDDDCWAISLLYQSPCEAPHGQNQYFT